MFKVTEVDFGALQSLNFQGKNEMCRALQGLGIAEAAELRVVYAPGGKEIVRVGILPTQVLLMAPGVVGVGVSPDASRGLGITVLLTKAILSPKDVTAQRQSLPVESELRGFGYELVAQDYVAGDKSRVLLQYEKGTLNYPKLGDLLRQVLQLLVTNLPEKAAVIPIRGKRRAGR